MSYLKYLGNGILVGGILAMSVAARAFIIPVASTYEISFPDLQLMVESELTRWKEEALKYQEMAYTDILGRVGGGGLNDGGLMSQMQRTTRDSARLLQQSQTRLANVTNLSTYTNATKKQIEDNFIIQSSKSLDYTKEQREKIEENQREAINDWASTGIGMAMGALESSRETADESNPKTRAGQMSQARDLNSMRELMLRMDRTIYARQLQLVGMEATDAGIRALQILQGISQTATGVTDTSKEGG